MLMKKIENCPFCGGKAKVKKAFVYMDEARFVACRECGTRTKFVLINHPALTIKDGIIELDESTRYTPEDAEKIVIDIWNKRLHT